VPETPSSNSTCSRYFGSGATLRLAASSDLLQLAHILNRLALLCKCPVVPELVLMQFGPIKHKAQRGGANIRPLFRGSQCQSSRRSPDRRQASRRDCFVALLLAMTAICGVIASVAKQSRRLSPGTKCQVGTTGTGG
jgi:hypothetical protein